jgi:hypothetical protein
MEWQIRIEGQPKQRILVVFDPEKEQINFNGQYSIKNKWVNFSNEVYGMDIDLETIQLMIGNVYDKMKKRLDVYEDLNKSFNVIKMVEIQDEIKIVNDI